MIGLFVNLWKETFMKTQIQKSGDNLILSIPKSLAKEIKIEENSVVQIRVRDGNLILSPVQTYRLEDLLEQITDENKHGEISTGISCGKEIC